MKHFRLGPRPSDFARETAWALSTFYALPLTDETDLKVLGFAYCAMNAIQCLTTRGVARALPMLATTALPSAFIPFIRSSRMTIHGCAPTSSFAPCVGLTVVGAVSYNDAPHLALHVEGLPGAILCCGDELEEFARIISCGDVCGGRSTIRVDGHDALLKVLGDEGFTPMDEFVSSIVESLSVATADLACAVHGMETMLLVSDRLRRQNTRVLQTFPYHCGATADQGVRRLFCTDDDVCGQFIPFIRHGDKVLSRSGVATFIGVTECDGDWSPFWHCTGASHASMWPEGQVGRRVVIGRSPLQYNGPTRDSLVGGTEDVRRYLHYTSPKGPFDETKWLNEGLFGVSAGSMIGTELLVLGVAPHQVYPQTRLDLYLQNTRSEEIIPLSRTQGIGSLQAAV